ncbi:BTB/POZ domain-containing protein 19 isoform X1 [Hirundo rustica]|uniref:BTB/POZ domain-containing protein 19 isoform X1 n=1 Tax=Hirundo rustica TaxID=43150 RepID=UPI001A94FF4F|nr:BTB/POZ domain-containing protein 19 isoform X1 [Hirundo rustica]
MAGPCPARLQGDVAAFTAALRSLVNNPQFSDVMFVVGQEQRKVFAHRCVLACRCQAFRGMLSQAPVGSQDSSSSVPPQGPFILGNVQPEVFLAVIEFLYTNSVTLNSHIALEVLTSSVEYGLQDLCKVSPVGSPLKRCSSSWESHREIPRSHGERHGVSHLLHGKALCQVHQGHTECGAGLRGPAGCSDLWAVGPPAALPGLHRGLHRVVRTQGFRELSDVVLARVLRSDRLAVDELDLVQAVREWAHVSSAVLERPVPEVAALPVRELRLPLLAPSELVTLESYNQQDLLIPVENIAAAWRAHALRKGSGVPSRLCRPRRGTRPRDHHRHLEPHAK